MKEAIVAGISQFPKAWGVYEAECVQSLTLHFNLPSALPPRPFLSCSPSRIPKCLPISGSLSLHLPMYACLLLLVGISIWYGGLQKDIYLHRLLGMEGSLASFGQLSCVAHLVTVY